MTSPIERHRIPVGKGVSMRFMFDTSTPPTSPGHNWAEMRYDGAPDSWVPEIGAHWHAHHDEHMECLEGRASFTLGSYPSSQTTILSAGDPPLLIPRYTTHSFKFFKGEAATLKESASPAGTYKQEFFEDLFYTGSVEKLGFLQVVRVFHDGDAFIALPGGIGVLDRAFTYVVGWLASWLVQGKMVKIDGEGNYVEGAKDK
ncbi:hypothetical protein BT63DRAFT_419746 [Microthyrium microscopicum]|uniref:Cupin 2 conserved barrel domain-containing protein n=1 Tax=Microthyrium microscopicum TaxID=703497 RepID=A0A6A6UU47_9PEZI|nr:hypothetical protein BT63DRAFT_419746 [Microthyrium microscopicum]